MKTLRRAVAFGRRCRIAYDLWERLGFPPALAWQRAGEWA